MPIDSVNPAAGIFRPGAANRLINLMGAQRGGSVGNAANVRPTADIPSHAVPAVNDIDRDGTWVEATRAPIIDHIELSAEGDTGFVVALQPPREREAGSGGATDQSRPQPESTAHPWDPWQAYAQRSADATTAATGSPAATTVAGSGTGESAAASDTRTVAGGETGAAKTAKLTDDEREEVERLAKGDVEIRRHEEAHVAAAGSLRVSGPHYDYATGPDGQRYAVAGVVNIDTTPIPGDPKATIAKMQQVRRAALAPESPSGADRAVARQASRYEAEARRELAASGGGSTTEADAAMAADGPLSDIGLSRDRGRDEDATSAHDTARRDSASDDGSVNDAGVYGNFAFAGRDMSPDARNDQRQRHQRSDGVEPGDSPPVAAQAGPSRLEAAAHAIAEAPPRVTSTQQGMAAAVASIPPGYQAAPPTAGRTVDLAA